MAYLLSIQTAILFTSQIQILRNGQVSEQGLVQTAINFSRVEKEKELMNLTIRSIYYKMWKQKLHKIEWNLNLVSLKYFIMPTIQICGPNTIQHVKLATSPFQSGWQNQKREEHTGNQLEMSKNVPPSTCTISYLYFKHQQGRVLMLLISRNLSIQPSRCLTSIFQQVKYSCIKYFQFQFSFEEKSKGSLQQKALITNEINWLQKNVSNSPLLVYPHPLKYYLKASLIEGQNLLSSS